MTEKTQPPAIHFLLVPGRMKHSLNLKAMSGY